MKLIKTLYSIVFVLFLSVANAAEKVKLVTLDNFKPYRWTENGQLVGIDIDILNEISKRTNIEFEYELVPWKRLIHYTKMGLADGAFSANKTAERETFAHFLTVPIHLARFRLFVLAGSLENYQKLSDLTGKTIAKVSGFYVSEEFKNARAAGQFKVVEVKSSQKYIELLLRGRIDGFVAQEISTKYELFQQQLHQKIISSIPVSPIKAGYIMISKASKLPQKDMLIDKMNNALLEMKKEGVFDQINRIYISDQ